jgi:hypothetical protein
MFALMAHGRNGGQFLAAVCATKREAVAVADRIGGLKIIGPLASVIIPHARWRLCQLRKAEGGVPGGCSRVISPRRTPSLRTNRTQSGQASPHASCLARAVFCEGEHQ